MTRILYIEDDRGLALLLKKTLERSGFAVDLAPNGEEGLRMFDPAIHDVIAVDQNMPGMDGLDVIAVLAQRDPIPPIVMITGNGDERVAVEAMKRGARDYIVKDVDGGYLQLTPAVIEKVLYQQQLIDEKRKAEETLRQSEERYRSLVELSPDGIIVCRDDRFVYVNDAATQMLAAPDACTLLGCAVSDVLHPDCYEMVWTQLQRTQTHNERVMLLEGKLIRFDNQAVDVEIMAAPIMFENQAATQMLIREVTERKRTEEAQRESERLRIALDKEKELGELKTRFMITISHEFRTPLSVAYSSAELLQKYYEKMSLKQKDDHLQKIETQISRMTDMIEDISVLIHATFERLVLNLEPTDLKTLCESVVLQMQSFDDMQQKIVLNADEYLPNLMVDVRRIKYILTNLLSNAIKYSGADSTITINLIRRADGVMVEVIDQGLGIPQEEQARIFEPFYRARNVGTIRGTGVGLSIVKEIVELHRGEISLKSEVDQGTEVMVFLPTSITGRKVG